MILQVDDDFADEIVCASLVDGYVMVKSFLKNEKNSHPEDIASWKELLPALETVGNWYMTDFADAVKKTSKKK
jgi:hypothetical protein